MRSREEIFDEGQHKRALADQAVAQQNNAKRQKIEASAPLLQIQPLEPGPQSLAAVFTLTNNLGLQGFDATQVPLALATRISVKILATIDQNVLDQAVNVSVITLTGRGMGLFANMKIRVSEID